MLQRKSSPTYQHICSTHSTQEQVMRVQMQPCRPQHHLCRPDQCSGTTCAHISDMYAARSTAVSAGAQPAISPTITSTASVALATNTHTSDQPTTTACTSALPRAQAHATASPACHRHKMPTPREATFLPAQKSPRNPCDFSAHWRKSLFGRKPQSQNANLISVQVAQKSLAVKSKLSKCSLRG